MKKLLFIALGLFSMSSFAQVCYVDMVDTYTNRVIPPVFTGYSYNTSICRDGLRDCNRSIREQGLDTRRYTCQTSVRRGPHYPSPRPPMPPRRPIPRPTPQPDRFDYLLSYSNSDVAIFAERGEVGSCRVERGTVWDSCGMYVKVDGYGYPTGTGCAKRTYTASYGCNSYNQTDNAGCLVKKAIRQNRCR